MEKGLFSALFIITMILLLTPTIIISDQSKYVTDTYNHLNLLTLSGDNVIVDALMDDSFSSCAVRTSVDYESRVRSYLANLIDEANNLSTNITCNYKNYNGVLVGPVYSGSVDFMCIQNSKYNSVLLEKKLYFEKNISTSFVAPNCTITITDSLDASNVSAQQTR